jgi:Protein of unknown function (DUF3025)
LLVAGRIDWTRPWLAPWRTWATLADGIVGAPGSCADRLNAALMRRAPIELSAGRLCFVPHTALPAGEAYEQFIARSACVPTRDNLHDFFNGLAWLRFPALKRALNAWQAEVIVREGVGGRRGALRDALTVFDENAVLWHAPEELTDALRRRDWRTLFIDHRGAWRDAQPVLFGHALLEKLESPRKNIAAHVWQLPLGADPCAPELPWLTPTWLAECRLPPLPVLGVPGWWPDNETSGFYVDPDVFRPARG